MDFSLHRVRKSTLVILFICICSAMHDLALSSDTEYIAAVVEHVPVYQLGFVNKTVAISIMEKNMDEYEARMQEAKLQGAQIIVFPEDGLYGTGFRFRDEILPYLEPLPSIEALNGTIPCAEPSRFPDAPIFVRGSCLAQKYQMAMVFNMGWVEYCNTTVEPSCPRDGRYQWNTDVAFNEIGQFVCRYRKSHLYFEPQFNQPLIPDPKYFDTLFGVRFGVMICFDIMFPEPQQYLYQGKPQVDHMIYTSWWVNEPPLITGTQVQQAHGVYMGGNFLAAGIGLSAMQSGSGIYSGNLTVASCYNPSFQPKGQLLVGKLPINITAHFVQAHMMENVGEKHKIFANKDKEIIRMEYFKIQPSGSGSLSVKAGPLLCTAQYQLTNDQANNNDEIFGLVARYGIYNNLWPAEICALLRCFNESTCGIQPYLQASTTQFESWTVTASYSNTPSFVYAMAAGVNSTILNSSEYVINRDFSSISSTKNYNSSVPFLNGALFARYSIKP